MDIHYFFLERTRFIRHYYTYAGSIFRDTLDKISEGVPPYDEPSYDESGEPPYMAEWMDAKEGLEVVGLTCVSMLSESLNAYLIEWERKRGVQWEERERQKLFKKLGLKGYIGKIAVLMGASPSECPADAELLEQVTLARNAFQHSETIVQLVPTHRRADIKKYPCPFFMDEAESVYLEGYLALMPFLVPRVQVSQEKLHRAIDEAEKLASWLVK